MKKFIVGLLFINILFLSSCVKEEELGYSSNRVKDMSEVEMILDDMMEYGGQSDDTEVQYDLVSGVFTYVDYTIYMDSIFYNVYKGMNDGEYEFDNVSCNNHTGVFECDKGLYGKDKMDREETISLGELKGLLSQADVDFLVSKLKSDYGILEFGNVLLTFRLEYFENEDITLGEVDEERYLYLEEELISTDTKVLDGVVMDFRIVFMKDSGAEVFHVYID